MSLSLLSDLLNRDLGRHVQSSSGSFGGQVIDCGCRWGHAQGTVRWHRSNPINVDFTSIRGSPGQRG